MTTEYRHAENLPPGSPAQSSLDTYADRAVKRGLRIRQLEAIRLYPARPFHTDPLDTRPTPGPSASGYSWYRVRVEIHGRWAYLGHDHLPCICVAELYSSPDDPSSAARNWRISKIFEHRHRPLPLLAFIESGDGSVAYVYSLESPDQTVLFYDFKSIATLEQIGPSSWVATPLSKTYLSAAGPTLRAVAEAFLDSYQECCRTIAKSKSTKSQEPANTVPTPESQAIDLIWHLQDSGYQLGIIRHSLQDIQESVRQQLDLDKVIPTLEDLELFFYAVVKDPAPVYAAYGAKEPVPDTTEVAQPTPVATMENLLEDI